MNVTPPHQPLCQLIRKTQVRVYARKIAREWGVDYSRVSPSFFVAVDEATRRAVAALVLSNDQRRRKRKTLQ